MARLVRSANVTVLADPEQFRPIPFPAKALKLLLHDAQTASANKGGDQGAPEDAVSDDEDDEWADEGAEFTAGNEKDLDFLSGELPSLLDTFAELC